MLMQPQAHKECARKRLILVLTVILGALTGCSSADTQYRDSRLGISFQYPEGWEIVSTRDLEDQTELEFAQGPIDQTWINVTVGELRVKGTPSVSAEVLLLERIEDRKNVIASNSGELISFEHSSPVCHNDNDCCSANAELEYNWLRDISSLPVTTIELREDIRVLSCNDRASAIAAMRYAVQDPETERFVRKVMESFHQIQ